MKIELILLAAGQSKRFGGIKQLADINGSPMLCHCLSPFRQGDNWLHGLDRGIVVLGSTASQIRAVLPTNIETFTVDSWRQGMGHTIAQSMRCIADDTSHVLIALGDQINITQQQIKKLIEAYNQDSSAPEGDDSPEKEDQSETNELKESKFMNFLRRYHFGIV